MLVEIGRRTATAAAVAARRASARQMRRRPQRDAGSSLPLDSVMLSAPALRAPPQLAVPALPDLDGGFVDFGVAPDDTHETPKPSCAVGAGGVVGEGGTSGSSPAAGLLSPQVGAQRPPSPHTHELSPPALLVLAFVLVWFVAWVGLCVFPPRVYALGSAVGDASAVFVVPALASLRFAFDRVRQYV